MIDIIRRTTIVIMEPELVAQDLSHELSDYY